MTQKNVPELLAPGGSVEGIRGAVTAGADAVYVGGSRFGARAYAQNPEDDKLLEMIDFCHIHGRKLYLTVNTLLKEEELKKHLYDYMLPVYEAGVDAVLVQDLGVLRFLRREFPALPLHASTQMSVQSPAGASFLQENGVIRIVPARELTLEEIREIYRATGMEIECFIHGALCYSYSGQCLLSSLIGGRSGNRGRCAQPCRLSYDLYDSDGKRLNRKDRHTLLSLRDICALDLIPDLHEAGVCSLKIEGRMKKPEYAAGVTHIYRKYLDRYAQEGRAGYQIEEEDKRILRELFSRGSFNRGYYVSQPGPAMMDERPRNKEGQTYFSARDEKLFGEIRETFLNVECKEKIKGIFILEAGKEAILRTSLGETEAAVSGSAPQKALSRQVTEEEIRRQLVRTGQTPFVFDTLTIRCGPDLFLPMGEISRMRREALTQLSEKLLQTGRRKCAAAEMNVTAADHAPANKSEKAAGLTRAVNSINTGERRPASPRLTCFVQTPAQMKALSKADGIDCFYVDAAWWMDRSVRFKPSDLPERRGQTAEQIILSLPVVWSKRARDAFFSSFDEVARRCFDGFLLRCADQLGDLSAVAMGMDKPVFTDSGIYVWNNEAAAFVQEHGVSGYTLPVEENLSELSDLAAGETERELILYGYLPVMTTRNCLMKNTRGCVHTPGVMTLRDRTGASFPVSRHCGQCGNVIYNSLPLSLLDMPEVLRRLCPDRVRLHFTTEEPAECVQTAKRAAGILAGGDAALTDAEKKNRTHGHIKRGVL